MRLLPGGKLFGLVLRKAGLHRKIGPWQVQRFLEFQRFGHECMCPQWIGAPEATLVPSECRPLIAVPWFRCSARNIAKRCNCVCYNDWQSVSAVGVAQPFLVRSNLID